MCVRHGAVLRHLFAQMREEKRLLGVESSPALEMVRELLARIENLEFFENRIKKLLKD